jgi:hypothetical protein
VGGLVAPNMHGYDHFAGTLGNLEDHFDHERVVDGVLTRSTRYALTEQVDDALAWILGGSGPWLCYVAFNSIHAPLHAPPDELHGVDLTPTGDPTKDSRAMLDAMVEALDTEIGRLLAGLGPELDDTTVVFLGDNGTPGQFTLAPFDPAHGKATMHEGGLQVPLIVAGPRVAVPGAECAALVHASDVFATVAELAGVDPTDVQPPGTVLDSISLVPWLEDPGRPSARDTLVAEFFFPNGPGEGAPEALPDLGPSICQTDLGLGGPGTTRLSLCGAHLAVDAEPTLEVTGAPPFSTGLVIQSLVFDPQPVGGGVKTTGAPLTVHPFTADAQGTASVPGLAMLGIGIRTFLQAVVEQPGLPGGYELSNTVQADFLPWNLKAARDARYKLIRSVNGGPTALYDLAVDPFETTNLLAAPFSMSAEDANARDRLVAALDAL